MVRPVSTAYDVSLGYREKANFDPNYIHRGIDYACPQGTKVVATREGEVVFAGWGGGYGSDYGIQVVIRVGSIWCLYAHLSSESVSVGQKVKTGQQIGKSGATGNVTGAHLHYQENTKPPAHYTSDRKPQFINYQEDDMPTPEEIFAADVIRVQAPIGTEESRKKNPNWRVDSVLSTMLREQAKQTIKQDEIETELASQRKLLEQILEKLGKA